ncbi:MAG: VWA domain-containing protein [Firmicutes bacterium]|nr:VWA domain-containing protein [Bacillota bacterium]
MRKDPRCPNCGDKGDVDSRLKCGVCTEQLEYADAEGTLKTVDKEFKCQRCGAVSSKDVQHCESCGAVIGKYCEYCKTYHYIESPVCPKTGETLKTVSGTPAPKNIFSKIAAAAGFVALLAFGIFGFNGSHKTAEPVKPSPSPSVVSIHQGMVRTRIDVVFVVDCTGSMQDEIDVVKNKIQEMISKISSGQPKPEVRYGVVAYRDRGDEFVTKKFDFSGQLEQVRSYVNQLQADGGGDTPESVNEALHVAIDNMDWDKSANTGKMLFLIGDAGPHTDYAQDWNFQDLARSAKAKGIRISTIGCSGINESGDPEFKEIAQLSGGQFDYLTYSQAYVKPNGEEVRVLKAGDKAYEVTGGAKEEWREGYASMEAKKNARAIAPAASAPGGTARGSFAGEADMKAKGEMENNLDRVISDQIQKQAESQGIKY